MKAATARSTSGGPRAYRRRGDRRGRAVARTPRRSRLAVAASDHFALGFCRARTVAAHGRGANFGLRRDRAVGPAGIGGDSRCRRPAHNIEQKPRSAPGLWKCVAITVGGDRAYCIDVHRRRPPNLAGRAWRPREIRGASSTEVMRTPVGRRKFGRQGIVCHGGRRAYTGDAHDHHHRHARARRSRRRARVQRDDRRLSDRPRPEGRGRMSGPTHLDDPPPALRRSSRRLPVLVRRRSLASSAPRSKSAASTVSASNRTALFSSASWRGRLHRQ